MEARVPGRNYFRYFPQNGQLVVVVSNRLQRRRYVFHLVFRSAHHRLRGVRPLDGMVRPFLRVRDTFYYPITADSFSRWFSPPFSAWTTWTSTTRCSFMCFYFGASRVWTTYRCCSNKFISKCPTSTTWYFWNCPERKSVSVKGWTFPPSHTHTYTHIRRRGMNYWI